MKKCARSGMDLDLALLSLRSTPLDSNLPSPAELLNDRQFRTTVPTIVRTDLKASGTREYLEARQNSSKNYYDRNVKTKAHSIVDQPVHLYDQQSCTWKPALIKGIASTPRSFKVQLKGGSTIRRNPQQIKSTREQWSQEYMSHDLLKDIMNEMLPDIQNSTSLFCATFGSSQRPLRLGRT